MAAEEAGGARPCIVLFKEADQRYAEALAAVPTTEVEFWPLLQTQFLPQGYEEVLASLREATALIVTSGTAVKALVEAVERSACSAAHLVRLANITWVTVGTATGDLIRASFGSTTRVFGEESGSARQLAPAVIDWWRQQSSPGHLCYACGAQRRDELPLALKAADIPFAEYTVYDAAPSAERAQAFWAAHLPAWTAFPNPQPVQLVVFSPAGALALLAAAPADAAKLPMTLVALGPTTAAALRDHCERTNLSWRIFQSTKPNPAALCETLRQAARATGSNYGTTDAGIDDN